MPIQIPKRVPPSQKTISQFIERQLPDFVKDDDPMFVAFLKAYYEWMETNGQDIFSCKIVGATQNTVVLTPDASIKINAYAGKNIVCLNGPTKGYTRRILEYAPDTQTLTIDPWDPGFTPLLNTKVVIRDNINPRTLLQYKDIDTTLDNFINFFHDEFMYQIPGSILADKRNILKHIKDFYQARGTENSFRFLFRILYNEEIEIYYPKVDLFRASDAIWSFDNVMKITTTGDTFDFVNRQLIGVASNATARVESATQQTVAGGIVTELKLSSIDGTFTLDPNRSNLPEQVKIVYPVSAPPQTDLGDPTDLLEDTTVIKWEQTYQLLQQLLVNTPGQNYQVGELITIAGGGELSPATAVITSIFETIFVGGCSPPPSIYYLEPYFGPDDSVNTDGNPLDDAVCIPGLYFFSDVMSDYTINDLLNSTEIALAITEINIDDYFVGDQITLISGTGNGQTRNIVSYNGTTRVATVDVPFYPLPDQTTGYSITHVKGGIKSVSIIDFGLGFMTDPVTTIHTAEGTGAVLPPLLGLVGQTAGMWLPGRAGGIGGAATTTDSFASSNKIIQDSYYWQDFSYDLRTGETINQYRDTVKALLHPAGMKMFGTVLLKSNMKPDFLQIITNYVLEIGNKFFDMSIDSSSEVSVQPSTRFPGTEPFNVVVGARNQDLDGMKFRAFPPNYNFNLIYPFPNATYWTKDGPGNTQLSNFQNVVIGTIISNPDRRTKINADAYVIVNSGSSQTTVGIVGQSRAAISLSRFIGFPPYEGFYEPYPSPNENYWDGPLGGFGETQLSSFQNIPLSDMITDPRSKRSNICVDGDFLLYRTNGPIPSIGDQVEYSFLEGMVPQIVYNVAPDNFDVYDAALGSDINTNANDAVYGSEGVTLTSSSQEIVNATAIPQNLKSASIIVVAKASGLSIDSTIVGMIPNDTDNGYSIDLRNGGGLTFRVRYGSVEKAVDFPSGTISDGVYFMAVLRFDNSILSGTVLVANTSQTIAASFINYPVTPTPNSAGWYFGKPSTNIVPIAQPPALFEAALYGNANYKQNVITASPVTLDYFNGTIAYAIFYDRELYDFELDTIYNKLKTQLLAERSITL